MAFPTSVATDAELHVGVNLLETTLSAGIDAVQATISLTSTSNFPATGGFFRIGDELIEYTSIAALDATGCTRGVGGTVAALHAISAAVRYVQSAEYHNALKEEIKAIELSLSNALNETPSGTFDGANTLFTLSAAPILSSLQVFKNGIKVEEGSDFSIIGTALTLFVAPTITDRLICSYLS